MRLIQVFKMGFTILMTVGVSCVAFADDASLINQPQSGYSQEFKALDSNGDGKLSATEVGKDTLFEKGGFAKADKNHNHSLSEDEYSAYKSAEQKKILKRAAKDAAITTKIRSQYLVEKNFKSFDVSIETKDGIVLLSGFVENADTKARAEKIAAGVKGVKSIKNALVVKPS
ncbi:MAG: BON domain-containing protein [Methylophilus sp.]|nr:BON domain-containing protein [Methylophilus sp.]